MWSRVVEYPQYGEQISLQRQVAGHERSGHTQLSRRPQHAPHRIDGVDPNRPDASEGTDTASVPELESHRQLGAEEDS
jgi:hypothetical protein